MVVGNMTLKNFEELVLSLLECTKELSEGTKRDICESRKEIMAGKILTMEDVRKE
jgi:hypothetical protein